MRLLLLGGTRFLGRHLAQAALARGHAVAAFTRGRLQGIEGAAVLVGDRDPRKPPGLAALDQGEWDAVIDTSGYVPRNVEASVRALADRAGRYLFVSSVSALARTDRPGLDESADVAMLDDPGSEDVVRDYGALKATCEAIVREVWGARATVVRPGLIVGPGDATDRFGYWPARFVAPELLGDRPPLAVVPAPPSRPLQIIDVRDLASWLVALIEADSGGTFHACSPRGCWTFADLVEACSAVAQQPPAPAWIGEDVLAAYHVEPWVGLPLWIPSSDANGAGFMEIDAERARAGGLAIRPLETTVADTAAWLRERDNGGAWARVLSAARERQILSACRRL